MRNISKDTTCPYCGWEHHESGIISRLLKVLYESDTLETPVMILGVTCPRCEAISIANLVDVKVSYTLKEIE